MIVRVYGSLGRQEGQGWPCVGGSPSDPRREFPDEHLDSLLILGIVAAGAGVGDLPMATPSAARASAAALAIRQAAVQACLDLRPAPFAAARTATTAGAADRVRGDH